MIRLCDIKKAGLTPPYKKVVKLEPHEENPAATLAEPSRRVNQNIDDTEDSSTTRRAESFPKFTSHIYA